MEELVLNNRRLKLVDGEIYIWQAYKKPPVWHKLKPTIEKKNGYWLTTIAANGKSRQFKWHRVLYKFHNKDWDIMDSSYDNQIDHIDLNKANNVIENLRIANASENQQNRNDVKGYYYNKAGKYWRSYITINRYRHHLGNFETEAEAIEARRVAQEELYTHNPL
tara:strand:- start:39 stop:530 length:492 start_codon:yes stop_codon:yes gene_type:complete